MITFTEQMRVALLLTGQLRTFDMVKYLHRNNIIQVHDCDIFLSIDCDNRRQCISMNSSAWTDASRIQEAVNFFQPKDYHVSTDYDTEYEQVLQENDKLDPKSAVHRLFMQQYFVVQRAYTMLAEYMQKHDAAYDVIVRLRFDQFLWCSYDFQKQFQWTEKNGIRYNEHNMAILRDRTAAEAIDFPEVSDKEVYVLGKGMLGHNPYCNDQFFFHHPNLIPTMTRFYDELPELIANIEQGKNGRLPGFPHIENAFYDFLVRHDIDIRVTHLKGVFVRQLVT
ncbi:hypothetical protein EBZ80_21345 [bacterium]|nr:hypothetical protein [bacterium]